jgi:exodeoxyribonuclease VII large subunit
MQDYSEETNKVWTVSEINRAARETLEGTFGQVWVEGEISNFRLYPSGHAYFSLKDEEGQLAAAIFRYATRDIKFEVKDGLAVIALGELTVYEKRGQYQLVAEKLEPKGKGALQLAFEQLKEKLRKEGLFEEERKQPLPSLPRRVGVVTSPRGAAVRDIINVLTRRFAGIGILLNPVRVQGEGAAREIAAAIGEFNRMEGIDVLIVGRGGGSMEDLWAFNEEVVARAIAASKIPVISAVGHEIDYTIADFVADLRAPTPSAAAELVVESRENLASAAEGLKRHLVAAGSLALERARHRLEALALRRMTGDARRRLRELSQLADDLAAGLREGIAELLESRRRLLAGLRETLSHLSPRARHALHREGLRHSRARLETAVRSSLEAGRQRSRQLAATLEALSPLAVLARGYSICRRLPALEVVKDAGKVPAGEDVTVKLHRGELHCRVTRVLTPKDAGDVDV